MCVVLGNIDDLNINTIFNKYRNKTTDITMLYNTINIAITINTALGIYQYHKSLYQWYHTY